MFFAWGAILAGLAVVAGAFGAHGLEGRVSPEMLEVFETAARYQMYHALALLAVGLAGRGAPPSKLLNASGWLFAGGILVFSGTLYLLAFTEAKWWGAITPIGGAAMIAGWACLSIWSFGRGRAL